MRSRYQVWLELVGWFGLSLICLAQQGTMSLWWQLLCIWLGFIVLALVSGRLGYRTGLLYPTAFLVGLSWIFLYRLRPEWAAQQFTGFVVGVGAYFVGLLGSWASRPTKYVFGLAAITLLLVTLLFGVWVGGAKAWLALGPLRFQPVEFARVLLMLFVVGYLVENRTLLHLKHGWAAVKYWGPLLVFMSGVFLLLAVQRDLGPALLLFVVYCLLSMTIVFSWRLLMIYSGLALSGFTAAYFLFPHFRTRIIAWLNPWNHADGAGYQVLQGLFALKGGSVLGKGIGLGLGEVIPNVHTDFIFALIGEELGFVGTVAVLSSYLIMVFIGLKLCSESTKPLEQYTALGIVLLWSVQTFMIVGGIVRFVPLTGMTLPFLSFGSSSLVAQMWMLGILASVGRVNIE